MRAKLKNVLLEEELSVLKRTDISPETEIRSLTFTQLRVLGLEIILDKNKMFGNNIVSFASVVLTNRAKMKEMAIF